MSSADNRWIATFLSWFFPIGQQRMMFLKPVRRARGHLVGVTRPRQPTDPAIRVRDVVAARGRAVSVSPSVGSCARQRHATGPVWVRDDRCGVDEASGGSSDSLSVLCWRPRCCDWARRASQAERVASLEQTLSRNVNGRDDEIHFGRGAHVRCDRQACVAAGRLRRSIHLGKRS